eukprot:TRINITY_DN62832_c0_g1_i1.p1 TRINITY_DN62832_c0_g1~~TRINITY_DN62832_c0_g1_i1.p1  ORF type:complete len:282 (-),score=37.30 TRINITY_DN62832_c0_g1_i1:41-886(-)
MRLAALVLFAFYSESDAILNRPHAGRVNASKLIANVSIPHVTDGRQESELSRQMSVLLQEVAELRQDNMEIRNLMKIHELARSEQQISAIELETLNKMKSSSWEDGESTVEVSFGILKLGKWSKCHFLLLFFFLLGAGIICTDACCTSNPKDEHGHEIHGCAGLIFKLWRLCPLAALGVFGMIEFSILWHLGFLGNFADKLVDYAATGMFALAAIYTILVNLERKLVEVVAFIEEELSKAQKAIMERVHKIHDALSSYANRMKERVGSCASGLLGRRHPES